MKTGKKILATVIALVLALVMAMTVANAADYTVKPGGTVNVTLSKEVEGMDGSVSCSGGAYVQ